MYLQQDKETKNDSSWYPPGPSQEAFGTDEGWIISKPEDDAKRGYMSASW